jgi:transcriptional repressor NrdR
MKCPYCGETNTSPVVGTTHDESGGGIRRRRECDNCGNRFSTYERPVMATPQIVKNGGYREAFDREKLLQGLRTACVKRPVSSEDLESLVDRVEDNLRRLGQLEVESKFVGDLIVEGLKELDVIAYIRYTLVYLKLDSLAAIQAEVDKLMQEQNQSPAAN